MVTAAFQRGLLVLGAGKNAIRFSPPLVLTREQADIAVRIFDEALTEVGTARRRGPVHAGRCPWLAAWLAGRCVGDDRERAADLWENRRRSRVRASSSAAGTQFLPGATGARGGELDIVARDGRDAGVRRGQGARGHGVRRRRRRRSRALKRRRIVAAGDRLSGAASAAASARAASTSSSIQLGDGAPRDRSVSECLRRSTGTYVRIAVAIPPEMPGTVPELRKDPVTGRWVIISTDRRKRPNDFRLERVAAHRRRALSVLSRARGHDAARGAGVPAERRRAERARAGTCASCRTSFRRCRSRATSIARARGCSIG